MAESIKCSCGKDAGILGCEHLGNCEEMYFTPTYIVCGDCGGKIIAIGLSVVGFDFFTPICGECLRSIVGAYLDEAINPARVAFGRKWFKRKRAISEAEGAVKH